MSEPKFRLDSAKTMEIDGVPEESVILSMEAEHEASTVEFTSFTDFVHEKYVRKMNRIWPLVELALEKHGLSATLNLAERCITLSTTTKTKDPHMIHKARGCILLVSQFGFPSKMAHTKITDKYFDYIKTGYQDGGLAAIHGMKKEVYIKRRDRLFEHLKEIAIMNNCGVEIGEDCIIVAAHTHPRIKRFRRMFERCFFRDLDPTKLKNFGKCRIVRVLDKMEMMKI